MTTRPHAQDDDDLYPDDSAFDHALSTLDFDPSTFSATSALLLRNGSGHGDGRTADLGKLSSGQPSAGGSSVGGTKRDYREAEQYQAVQFGEFGRYMRNKRAKLQVQNKALLDDDQQAPQIFKGLAIYINGFTDDITLPELQELLIRHGAVYVPYLDQKGLVTHIIATNLTPRKRVEFAAYKVAKPEWLIDSAKAGRLLDWKEYALLAAPVASEVQTARGEQNATGMQSAQRSLFGMLRGAQKKADEGEMHGERSEAAEKPANVETRESLSARGARLAKEALAGTTGLSTAAPSLNTFFQPRRPAAPPPLRPATPKKRSTFTGEFSHPTPPAEATTPERSSHLPATTDSPTAPTEVTHSWLPKAQRSDRTNALLQDPDWLAKHTSASEDFLAGYFAQSRLHHLSSFKEELKLLVARHYADHPPPPPPKRGKRGKLTGTARDGRTVFHVDLDCAFVSAGLTTRPELRGKPVAVCHARGRDGSEASTSEIASCSYEAREKGVKNGMSLGRAKELCPDLQTMPFEFDLYKSISTKFYEILLSHASLLQVGSLDEVLMEVSVPPTITRESDPALALAHRMRAEILAATGCEASIGISHNILLARLATRKAKPASAFHLLNEDVSDFLAPLAVDSLPGIGWSLRDKLDEIGVKTVGDLLGKNKFTLTQAIGPKNAETFAAFAKGIDARELENNKARQSVSAEVNYGIRFGEGRYDQVERFIRELAAETTKRLRDVGLQARQLTLKVMIRHPDAAIETPKFLGHGWVNVENKVSSLSGGSGGGATDDAAIVGEAAWKLMKSFDAPPHELRGIGIQLQKLEKDGRPVDLVRERGQATLSFAPAPAKPAPLRTVAPPPPVSETTQQPVPAAAFNDTRSSPPSPPVAVNRLSLPPARPLSAHPSILTLSDSDDDDTPVAGPSRSRPDPAPAALPPRTTRAKSKRPVEKYIPSMFRPTKATVQPPSTAGSISDKELRRLGIDPAVFHELPVELQRDAVAQARRSLPTRASVPAQDKGKGKGKERAVSFAPAAIADLTLSSSSPATVSKGPEVIVLPPSPADAIMTDSQIVQDNFGENWAALGAKTQREQVLAYKQHAALRVKGNQSSRSASASARSSAPVKDVAIRLPPRFSGQTSLSDICDKVEQWVEDDRVAGPGNDDLDALARFVEKCAARDKGHNLKKATDVMKWWEMVLEGSCGGREEAAGMDRVWWEGYGQVRERLEWLVLKETGCRLL
ncbi:hypothetical protein JCM10207_003363 [Rhodosporidiobolus poonsookiae]